MDLKRNIKGQILLMSALMMPVLIFMTAMALDVGYLFDQRRREQIAADAGAEAAGIAVFNNFAATITELETVARFDAALNGFTHGVGGVTVTVHRPPVNGDFAGNNYFVEVIVHRPTPTFFMGILGPSSLMVRANAVAGSGNASGCLYALDNLSGVKSIEIANTKVVDASECEAYGNSDIHVDGSLLIDKVSVRGGRTGSGTVNGVGIMTSPDVITGVPPVVDPLAAVPWPGGECTSWAPDLILGADTTFTPPVAGFGCYNKIIVENVGTDVHFNPGRYHAKDGVFFKQGTNVTSTGTTFFIHNDKVEIAGDATLVAPTTMPSYPLLAGMLFFINRTLDKDIEIKNTAVTNLTGTIYSRRGKILYSGITSGTISYSILVAGRILFTDSGTVIFNNDFSSLPGGAPIKRPTLAD
jgi:hypothetical protein